MNYFCMRVYLNIPDFSGLFRRQDCDCIQTVRLFDLQLEKLFAWGSISFYFSEDS